VFAVFRDSETNLFELCSPIAFTEGFPGETNSKGNKSREKAAANYEIPRSVELEKE
jgi:hypothetical protein